MLFNRFAFEMAIKGAGLTPSQLAERCSVTRQYIYKLLSGQLKSPSGDKLMVMARELGVEPSQLFKDELTEVTHA